MWQPHSLYTQSSSIRHKKSIVIQKKNERWWLLYKTLQLYRENSKQKCYFSGRNDFSCFYLNHDSDAITC